MASVTMKRSISEDENGDESVPEKKPNTEELSQSLSCPYLDTIDRNVLDFDFEKLCSVSLSRVNVYACLVCGKYFQVKRFIYVHTSGKPKENFAPTLLFYRDVDVTPMHTRTP